MVIRWDKNKVNKYLKVIDGAIQRGKYHVALRLANRLLKHYYRSFIDSKIPTENEKDNIKLMSASISRYLIQYYRKCAVPQPEKRLMMMTVITNVIDVHNLYHNETQEESIIDKATATYVRENITSVICYLMRYF